jgi:hypothetical protein
MRAYDEIGWQDELRQVRLLDRRLQDPRNFPLFSPIPPAKIILNLARI